MSWVQGVKASFNVTLPDAIRLSADETFVEVSSSDYSQAIDIGITFYDEPAQVYWQWYNDVNNNPGQYITGFTVRPGDKIDTATQWGNGWWDSYIEDVTTGAYQLFSENQTTNITNAEWGLWEAGPVESRTPTLVGFSNATWYSNWAGEQPISSSAAHTYTQYTEVSSDGGMIETTEPADAGTSFALIPCPGCYP